MSDLEFTTDQSVESFWIGPVLKVLAARPNDFVSLREIKLAIETQLGSTNPWLKIDKHLLRKYQNRSEQIWYRKIQNLWSSHYEHVEEYAQKRDDGYKIKQAGTSYLIEWEQYRVQISKQQEEGETSIADYSDQIFLIFQGPPGTGKTRAATRFVISQIQRQIVGQSEGAISDSDMSLDEHWKAEKRPLILSAIRKYMSLVQFHGSYSYEDFVEGLRPFSIGEKKDKVAYSVFDGTLLAAIKRAVGGYITVPAVYIKDHGFQIDSHIIKNFDLDAEESIMLKWGDTEPTTVNLVDGVVIYSPPESENHQEGELTEISIKGTSWSSSNQYFIILDEINRANVSKVFGELLFLLGGSADLGLEVKTQYSKTAVVLPKNLHILGTMNSCDKSASNLDQALRRRFEFVELMPFSNIRDGSAGLSKDEEAWASVIKFFRSKPGVEVGLFLDSLNSKLTKLPGFDYTRQIGHSYFFKAFSFSKYLESKGTDKAHLIALYRTVFGEIFPVLQEILLDRRKSLEDILSPDIFRGSGTDISLSDEIREGLNFISLRQYDKFLVRADIYSQRLKSIFGIKIEVEKSEDDEEVA